MNISPTRIDLAITTAAGNHQLLRQAVDLRPASPSGDLGAPVVVSNVFDPYEDEAPAGWRPPADERRWRADSTATDVPAIRDAVAGMRTALDAVDWGQVVKSTPTVRDGERARLTLSFEQRPADLEHLRPVQAPDGEWLVSIDTSLDLFASPQLAPVVDAARAIIDLARPLGTPSDSPVA